MSTDPDKPDDVAPCVAEFMRLNRRRLLGTPPLTLDELQRWGELRADLESHFGGVGELEAEDERRSDLRLPTHLEIRFEVDVSRFQTFVSQPQGDDRRIHT